MTRIRSLPSPLTRLPPTVQTLGMHHKRTARLGASKRARRNARLLQREPLCRHCRAEGRYTPADEVDHIVPLADGGAEVDGNCQPLCTPHHQIKTMRECEARARTGENSLALPHWLPRPTCPVVLITGPPGGGKTTYADTHAQPGDVVIDLDRCIEQATGTHGHDAVGWDALMAGLSVRNEQLAALSRRTHGTAFVIVCCPHLSDRGWWTLKLNPVRCIECDPGRDTIAQRIPPRRLVLTDDWYATRRGTADRTGGVPPTRTGDTVDPGRHSGAGSVGPRAGQSNRESAVVSEPQYILV